MRLELNRITTIFQRFQLSRMTSTSLISGFLWRLAFTQNITECPKHVATGAKLKQKTLGLHEDVEYVWKYVMICTIWYHLYNSKNLKITHLECYVKLEADACNFTKSNTPPWVFFTFFKSYKWYEIAQLTTSFEILNVAFHTIFISVTNYNLEQI